MVGQGNLGGFKPPSTLAEQFLYKQTSVRLVTGKMMVLHVRVSLEKSWSTIKFGKIKP
jgi:hypothetical protein